jgi:hypothetical protein
MGFHSGFKGLTTIGLSSGGSTHLHTNNTQNNTNNNRTTQITNVEECGPCPVFASCTLAFALQLSKKQGKTSVGLRKTSVGVQYTYYRKTHTHTHTRARARYMKPTAPPRSNTDERSFFTPIWRPTAPLAAGLKLNTATWWRCQLSVIASNNDHWPRMRS